MNIIKGKEGGSQDWVADMAQNCNLDLVKRGEK